MDMVSALSLDESQATIADSILIDAILESSLVRTRRNAAAGRWA
jgi:hypothetical protein